MDQIVINWMMGGFGGLIGFMLHVVWQAVKDLQEGDKELTKKISEIEVLVAGAYVKRSDLSELSAMIFAKLDTIEKKLDHKADKP